MTKKIDGENAQLSDSERTDSLNRHEIERALTAWATSARSEFAARREFNHEIMARMARGGLTPTAAAVKRIGRWGQNISIAEDVEDWYRTLASRLDARDARIPPAAQAHANQLVESLWRLAHMDVDQARAEPLRQELGYARVKIDALQTEVESSNQQAQALVQEASLQSEQLDVMHETTASLQRSLASEKELATTMLADINNLKIEHARTLDDRAAQHAEVLDSERRSHKNIVDALQAQLKDNAATNHSIKEKLTNELADAAARLHRETNRSHEAGHNAKKTHEKLQVVMEQIAENAAHQAKQGARIAQLELDLTRERENAQAKLNEILERVGLEKELFLAKLVRLDKAPSELSDEKWTALIATIQRGKT